MRVMHCACGMVWGKLQIRLLHAHTSLKPDKFWLFTMRQFLFVEANDKRMCNSLFHFVRKVPTKLCMTLINHKDKIFA